MGFQQLAEGIQAQRIEVIGREQRGDLSQRIGAADARQPWVQTQKIGHAGLGHGFPYRPQLGASARPTVLYQSGSQRHGVDGAGAGGADPRDVERLVFEQTIEHAPGEGAMRATALERQIETLLPPEHAHDTCPHSLPTRIKATNRAASWQHVEGQHNGHAVEHVITGGNAVRGGKMLRR